MSEGGWQSVVHNSGTQSLRVTKCPLLTALIGTLLRKLVRYADSDKTPEGACCHQRPLRNSKTLLYRIVNNTLPTLPHFAKRKVYEFIVQRFHNLDCTPSKTWMLANEYAENALERFVYFVNGARRQQTTSGALFESAKRTSLRKRALIEAVERSI